jgi:pimeloyl-ACP methyl ester carboxylesterase
MHFHPAQVVQPEIVRAAVHVAGRRMVYWRGGSGPAVLLAHASAADAGEAAAWLCALAGRLRVFAPYPGESQRDEGEPSLALRLRHFLEGVGLERVSVIADHASAAEVLWLALAEPERIERIAIVLPEHPDAKCSAWVPPDRFERSRQPLLVIRTALAGAAASPRPSETALLRMVSFLAGDE